jgi:hypothetical protein
MFLHPGLRTKRELDVSDEDGTPPAPAPPEPPLDPPIVGPVGYLPRPEPQPGGDQ